MKVRQFGDVPGNHANVMTDDYGPAPKRKEFTIWLINIPIDKLVKWLKEKLNVWKLI